MSGFGNNNQSAMPPPPPPPPMNHMEMEQQVGMAPQMMESYDEDMAKMGAPNFMPHPPALQPQGLNVPPPPPVPMAPNLAVPQGVNMPGPGMVQNINVHAGPVKQIIDPYLAAEISSIVHTLSTSQLIYVLASLKKFLKHAPSEARRFLINNPQLTYALLHTQFILGEHDETILPLSKMDQDISQVNKLERSMHLKPFHNLYEESSVPVDHYPPEAYVNPQPYPTHEQTISQHMKQETTPHEPNKYQEQEYYKKQHERPKNLEATQADIDELMNMGIYPASAALVDEVIKNPEILQNIQRATREEMNSWPEEQKHQVLSIKIALHMRGISVNL